MAQFRESPFERIKAIEIANLGFLSFLHTHAGGKQRTVYTSAGEVVLEGDFNDLPNRLGVSLWFEVPIGFSVFTGPTRLIGQTSGIQLDFTAFPINHSAPPSHFRGGALGAQSFISHLDPADWFANGGNQTRVELVYVEPDTNPGWIAGEVVRWY